MGAGRGLKIELESKRRYYLICFVVGGGSKPLYLSSVRIIIYLRSVSVLILDNFGVVVIIIYVVDYYCCCYCYIGNHLLCDLGERSNRNRNGNRNVSWRVPAEERLGMPWCMYCGGSCVEYVLRARARRRAACESTTEGSRLNLFESELALVKPYNIFVCC